MINFFKRKKTGKKGKDNTTDSLTLRPIEPEHAFIYATSRTVHRRENEWTADDEGQYDVYCFGGQSKYVSGTYRRQVNCKGKSISCVSAKGSRCFAMVTSDGFLCAGEINRTLCWTTLPLPAVKCVCAMDLVCAILVDGSLWKGILAGSDEQILHMEKGPTFPGFLVDVKIGRAFSCFGALTNEGVLYVWGEAKYGILGQGQLDANAPRLNNPVPVKLPGKVISFDIGEFHMAAITDRGEIYVWGDNSDQSLIPSLSDTPTLFSPEKLPLPPTVQKPVCIECGKRITMFVTEDGTVFEFGSTSANLYCSKNSATATKFVTVSARTDLPPIVEVVIGLNHAIARTKDGSILTWGRNDHDKLGFKEQKSKDQVYEIVTTPCAVDCLNRKVAQCTAGSGFSMIVLERRLFGEDLVEVMSRDENTNLPAPRSILELGQAIYKIASGPNDLLMVSGNKAEIQKLIDELDRGIEVDFSLYLPNSLLDVFKHYINNLPIPVIPFDSYETITTLGTSNADLSSYRSAILKFPLQHRNLLYFTIDLLKKILDSSVFTSQNIVSVFRGIMRISPQMKETKITPLSQNEKDGALKALQRAELNALTTMLDGGAKAIGCPVAFGAAIIQSDISETKSLSDFGRKSTHDVLQLHFDGKKVDSDNEENVAEKENENENENENKTEYKDDDVEVKVELIEKKTTPEYSIVDKQEARRKMTVILDHEEMLGKQFFTKLDADKDTMLSSLEFRTLVIQLCKATSREPPDDGDIAEGIVLAMSSSSSGSGLLSFQDFCIFWRWYRSH